MKRNFDEAYVAHILRDMPAGLNEQQFRAQCKADLNACYYNEVEEALHRYVASSSEQAPR